MIEFHASHFDLRQIADSGQCFRLTEQPKSHFTLVALGRVLHMQQTADGSCRFRCSEQDFRTIWRPYFDLSTDYGAFIGAVPKSDQYLRAAAQFGGGIRILRQQPWETLITFIISQRKNIPAIRQAVETLCTRYGKKLTRGAAPLYAFPAPQALAHAGEDALRACALGYRAPYIAKTAAFVSSGAAPLDTWSTLPDDALREQLLSLPGVGVKVANCVMLFGFHRIGAFPRDVWIERVLQEQYSGDFPLDRYSGFAGVMQQYLFYYARKQ